VALGETADQAPVPQVAASLVISHGSKGNPAFVRPIVPGNPPLPCAWAYLFAVRSRLRPAIGHAPKDRWRGAAIPTQ
jgi:hypothetical protein